MLTFVLLSILMVIGAVGVITLKQPVHAALSLVGTLLTLAITYVTLEAHFLAAIQVIVYAGAIMVLFLFVIMLLNVQYESRAQTRWLKWVAYATGLSVALALITTVLQNPRDLPGAEVIAVSLGGGGASQIADALFSNFVLPFQLVGVLLLTGIIGAVSLVERKAVAAQAATVMQKLPDGGGHDTLKVADRALPAAEAVSVAKDAPLPGTKQTSAKALLVEQADDLTQIKGIGQQLEQLLHENNIRSFAQIASFSAKDIEDLDEQLGAFRGRILRDNWVEQAQTLMKEQRS